MVVLLHDGDELFDVGRRSASTNPDNAGNVAEMAGYNERGDKAVETFAVESTWLFQRRGNSENILTGFCQVMSASITVHG